MNNDRTTPVMVTGATGFVAGWLVKKLLEQGYTVHAAVRNPERTEKIAHLNKIASGSAGSIKYFKADLLTPDAYKEAMKGCGVVFHTASPFTSEVKDPQKELVDPAVNGTENVLQSVNETASVKRVVLTSSCAAIYSDAIDCALAPNGVLTEEIWNTTSSLNHNPYSLSKTLAEKKAWEIAKAQSNWDLVTINPSFVMGPMLNPKFTTSESFNILKQIGDGDMKMGAPKMGIGLVDVRDVANAHMKAAFDPKAQGRYITSGYNTDFVEMGLALDEKFGSDYKLPKKALPKWLLMIIGPVINKMMTRKFLRNNINIEWKADNSKIKNELGISFRPMKATMEDAFQSLVDAEVFKK
jgi:nucleoside-diphosphate-sugar epimerase